MSPVSFQAIDILSDAGMISIPMLFLFAYTCMHPGLFDNVSQNLFSLGQKMDDLSRIPGSHCQKVFIHRDYTNGTSLCFQTKFPQDLEGKVKKE